MDALIAQLVEGFHRWLPPGSRDLFAYPVAAKVQQTPADLAGEGAVSVAGTSRA